MNTLTVRLRASFRWRTVGFWSLVWIILMAYLLSTGWAVTAQLSLALLGLCVFPVIALSANIAIVQSGIFCKPVSFCLPKYRRNLRRIIFVNALPYAMFAPLILYLLNISVFEEPGLLERWLAAFGFVVVVMAFVVSGGLRFFLPRIAWSLGLVVFPLGFLGYSVLPGALEHPLLYWPVAISVCVVFCVSVWRGLGDMELVKGAHRRFVLDSVEQCTEVEEGGRTALPEVEGFFLSRMKLYGHTDTGRYVCGGLYRAFGPILSYWRWILLSVLGSALVLGYGGKVWQELAFVALGLMGFGIDLSVTLNMLLPGGRRERYYSAVVSGCAIMVLAMAAAAAVVGLSTVFVLFMPDIARYGLQYTGIRPATVYLACLLTPGLFGFKLLAYRMPIFATMSVYAFAIFLVVATIYLDSEVNVLSRSTGPILFASVFVSGCGFFLLILWRACAKWCLTKGERWEAL